MRIATALLIFLAASFAGAQPVSPFTYPSSPPGHMVAQYFKAFNSGDESAMRTFFSTAVSAEGLERAPLEMRMQRFRQFHASVQSLTPIRLVTADSSTVQVFVRTGDGRRLKLEFLFETSPKLSLVGIGIDDADTGSESGSPARNDEELVMLIRRQLDSLTSIDEFSGAVLLAKNGKPLFQQAYGLANKEQSISNTLETMFNVGSICKHFTAVVVHQLVAEGTVAFTDPIGKYLPDYPNRDAAAKVTIRHLLDMTSGIGDFFGDRFQAARKESINSIKAYLPLFADRPLEFEPGSRYLYSNGGYIVLGAIIEAVTGKDYYTVAGERLLKPAAMNSTAWFERTSPQASMAHGYTRQSASGGADSRRGSNVPFLPGKGSSAGGGYSTAGDLLRYTAAMQNEKIVPASFDGRGGFGIAGGTAGANAVVDWNPRTGYTIIVLSNYDPPSAQGVSKQIRAWLPR